MARIELKRFLRLVFAYLTLIEATSLDKRGWVGAQWLPKKTREKQQFPSDF